MKALIISLFLMALTGCASFQAPEPPLHLLGSAAPAGSGTRTIVITPQTNHVNVIGGEAINFQVDNKVFTWNFYVGASIVSFDLKRVAPDVFNRNVIAYVAPDPRYSGRDRDSGRR